MVPWRLSFQYFDELSGSLKEIKTKPGEKAYEDLWVGMLKDFSAHLKEKGWFDMTTIAMDERPLEQMQKAIALIREADPNFKVALAGNYHEEIESDIFDYCIASNQTFSEEVLRRRKIEGKKSTVYTCCSEPYPNLFTFSPPAEAAWHAWYVAAENFDGYLRWAFNSWVRDPLRDSRFRTWAAGDCYQVYPGGRSSIRFERLVEGLQDYEKIQRLREEFKYQPEQLKKLEELLKRFKIESLAKESAADMVNQARAVLNSL